MSKLIEYFSDKKIDNIYFDSLVERLISRFKWSSNKIDTTMFELAINGGVGVVAEYTAKNKDKKIIILPATINGTFDLDWQPKGYFSIGFGEMFNTKDLEKWLPIFTDSTRRSYYDICEYYAKQLAELDKALLSTIDNTKICGIVEVEGAGQLKAVQEASKLMHENKGILFIGKKSGTDLKATIANILSKDNTPMLERIQLCKTTILSQFEDEIGIGNTGREYHSQYISDTDQEIRSSQYSAILQDCLEWREKQCKRIREAFNDPSLTVEINKSIFTPQTSKRDGDLDV